MCFSWKQCLDDKWIIYEYFFGSGFVFRKVVEIQKSAWTLAPMGEYDI